MAGAALSSACSDDDGGQNDDGGDDGDGDGGDGDGDDDGGDDGGAAAMCDADNGSITLPDGFCASVFADQLGPARHLAVTPSGDVFVAVANAFEGPVGEVVALRDTDGDGIADEEQRFGDSGGNGIAWRDDQLFFAEDGAILRYEVPDGELLPVSDPEVVVSGLPAEGDHTSKTIVFADTGELMVNIGSESNSCQEENRVANSPGQDPCAELDVRAGIWTFDPAGTDQVQDDGIRFAEGLRNMVALAVHPDTGALFGAQNGRDQLYDSWPEVYQPEDEIDLPSEEVFQIDDGGSYGWPYCYHDPFLDQKVLAPEYGGDGTAVDLCADVEAPDHAFPAHWAPLGMHFYTGEMFPEQYLSGAFIAFHGSRFEPEATGALPGYNVVFLPFDGDLPDPGGDFEVFADDFAGDARPLPDAAEHRPVGLAEGPDGALYISDDHGGRIWRVIYTGE